MKMEVNLPFFLKIRYNMKKEGDTMTEKMITLLKTKDFQVPQILFFRYKELNITTEELYFLIYLLNVDSTVFNPKQMSLDLGIDMPNVLEIINELVNKDLLSLELKKEGNIRNEYLSVEKLYNKLGFLLINENTSEPQTNLFDLFEQEFGRTLSPIEYELINGWLDNEFTEELVKCALKEAVYNGVSNLRYIDKILYEWKRKGINNEEDVEKNKTEFQSYKEKEEKPEVFSYDWLNDNE